MNKREFFEWLRTTNPPRHINVRGPVYDWEITCYVDCILGPRGSKEGRTLQHAHGLDSADKHATRYRRWLSEFEAAAAEAGGK